MNDQIKELNEVWPPNEPIDNLKTWPEIFYVLTYGSSGIDSFLHTDETEIRWEVEDPDKQAYPYPSIKYIREDIVKEREEKLVNATSEYLGTGGVSPDVRKEIYKLAELDTLEFVEPRKD